jgi:hypothetical protein
MDPSTPPRNPSKPPRCPGAPIKSHTLPIGVKNLTNKFPKDGNLTKIADIFEQNASTNLGIPQEDASTQASALRSFAAGQMDYATMRSMCG